MIAKLFILGISEVSPKTMKAILYGNFNFIFDFHSMYIVLNAFKFVNYALNWKLLLLVFHAFKFH